jgi:hypothetical protein
MAEEQDSIYVPLFTYRTGAFANSGIPIANGMHDYLTMLNERDGGIGRVKLAIEECETGYDTKKGVECYEAVKGKNPVIVNPWSTGTTLQLIPKASVDRIPILSMAYGLSASAVGNDFPWIFNPPMTYWDGLSTIFKYIGSREGGLEKLKGKYSAKKEYKKDKRLKKVVDTLIDGTLSDDGTGMFKELYTSLLEGASWHEPDHYYLLLDFSSYVDTKLRINKDYADMLKFRKKCFLNVAGAGKFSSDRTIRDYSKEVWKT